MVRLIISSLNFSTLLRARARRVLVSVSAGVDGGLAAEQHLGYPIQNLLEAVLGEGEWTPRPESWKQGVERGQF